MLGGYDEIPLDLRPRPLTAFQTPLGYSQLTKVPQGYTNAIAVQMRVIRHVLHGEIPHVADAFLDDVQSGSSSALKKLA